MHGLQVVPRGVRDVQWGFEEFGKESLTNFVMPEGLVALAVDPAATAPAGAGSAMRLHEFLGLHFIVALSVRAVTGKCGSVIGPTPHQRRALMARSEVERGSVDLPTVATRDEKCARGERHTVNWRLT